MYPSLIRKDEIIKDRSLDRNDRKSSIADIDNLYIFLNSLYFSFYIFIAFSIKHNLSLDIAASPIDCVIRAKPYGCIIQRRYDIARGLP